MPGHLPADYSPGEHVDDEGGVHPAGEGPDVGDVSYPQAIRGGRGEPAIDQVGPRIRAGTGHGRPRPRRRRATYTVQALGPHQPLHGAAGHPMPLPDQLGVHLLRAVHREIVLVHPANVLKNRLVGQGALRRWPALGGVVGLRGDLQLLADRLDPELVFVFVDVADGQREGRSSSAAKKADALFRMAFARRSSRTSRSSSASRLASSVVVPGRVPSSISAWVTQLRSVSGLMPSCLPIRASAPERVAGSRRASTANRVARSRSSSGYFLGAAMTLILQWIESLHQTRGETMYRNPNLNVDGVPLEADHTLARAHGGKHADRLLLRACNRSRGDGTRVRRGTNGNRGERQHWNERLGKAGPG